MNDRRFLSILNEVAGTIAWGPLDSSSKRGEADAIEIWAEFLRRCVGRGVSVGDSRWQLLEAHRAGSHLRFRLAVQGEARTETRDDFPVGLALLMGVLHPEDPS